MADSLDVEETNRLRAALGMPLIPTSSSTSNLDFKKSGGSGDNVGEDDDPGSTFETREAAAGDNWRKAKEAEAEKKRKEAKRLALKKERDAAQRFAKLEGRGLGDADKDDLDTRSWLLESNKRQKKITKARSRMLQQELEERANQAQYTEKDLAGRRVAHEMGEFDEEGEHVLTLKDATIGGEESEDDELENIELRDREKLNERLKLKKQKTVYDPNADQDGEKSSVLAQYDEEIDGKKAKQFTIGNLGQTAALNGTKSATSGSGSLRFSLDLLQDEKPVSDYLDISEIKIKKPKKKKDKSKRQRTADEDDIFPTGVEPNINGSRQDGMELDNGQQNGSLDAPTKRKYDDISFVDDDDLQSNLANQRWTALKKRKRARPEDLARQIRDEASATPGAEEMETGEEEGGLVIDETTEFVSNLRKPQAPEVRRPNSTKLAKQESPEPATNGDTVMKEESDSENDEEAERKSIAAPAAPRANNYTTTGLEEEETFDNAGIGATIGMLKQRGLVKGQHGSELNVAQSRQTQFLKHKERLEKEWERKAQEKRKRDRENGLFERMSKRQQEEYAQQENRNRDQYVSRQMDELFNREYKPNVELKYVDEFGRRMDSREAFKQMSHQFHGKGSGKQKTEKRLKKIEEEKAREARSGLDSSQMSGMNSAAGTQARKQGAAGVRLQ